ncbi:hypothetical protein [Pseudomonas aeruginosa]|uniref:hypothetical protein n=1 Tax=Pseudomonas aeruginosa TaxID=287 RepID=UPI00292A699F|nr:hypothetical protein [Pseudomonas aeruginosa]HCE6202987.1 hypothetical protein [Pseudomonas aeruginosa]HCG0278885.1 hypothetical protein [Pseudomonas aeruginosa]HCG0298484.1 hypothetical protein [Pseudomonas aeruginosa]HCG0318964.1 hypothetical protein [Pseudomonas aeruginosa]
MNNCPIYFIAYPIACAQPSAKRNGKGTAFKGQRPYPEKEKAALSIRSATPSQRFPMP